MSLSSLMTSSPILQPSSNIAAYHFGGISRETAEEILFDLGCIDGMFLIRESTAIDSVLSLCHNKSILHYRISRIPSTGQVILHGTPIQVFPDFDTLIIKVQGLAIKPTIPCDRNEVNALYSLSSGGTIRHPPPTQPPPPEPFRRIGNQPQFGTFGSQKSFYGTHMHIHVKHPQQQHQHHSHTLSHNKTSLFNQLNKRSNSMWKIPLPEIKDAIIQKTKELDDDLVYDSSQLISLSTPGQKLIGPNTYNNKIDKKDLNDSQSSQTSASPAGVVLHPMMASTDVSEPTPTSNRTECIQHQYVSSSNMEISSGKQQETSCLKHVCPKCQRFVIVSDGTSSEKSEEEKEKGTTSSTTSSEGLLCRGCRRYVHFSCDGVTSCSEMESLRKISHRYVCCSCLDLLMSLLKETCHPSSMPQLVMQPHHSSSHESLPNSIDKAGLAKSASDAIESKGLSRKGENDATMPSKEEMKQIIKEVVDDVIRSTITQVMSERVSRVGCSNCSCPDSSFDSRIEADSPTLKTMPSVLALDKEAEEETKKTTKTEDLLLLLKSPDVEVKNFLLNSKTNSVHPHPLPPPPPSLSLDSSSNNPPSLHPKDHIISSEEIELKKKEILNLLKSAQTPPSESILDTGSSHASSQNRKNDESTTSVKAEKDPDIQEEDASNVDCRDVSSPSSQDDEEHKDECKDKRRDGEDSGEYESIRFDRDDLEPKSCLGFASIPLDSSSLVGNDKTSSVIQSQTSEGVKDLKTTTEYDQQQTTNGITSNSMNIQLNQVDLICLEDENQEKIQEMVRIYKKGPVSLDARFITLRRKIGSGFFGEVFLATIPLRSPRLPVLSTTTSASSTSGRSTTTSSSLSTNSEKEPSGPSSNCNQCNYIQVAVKVLKDSSLFNSRAELMKEATVMASLDHKHIIRLIGISGEDSPPSRDPFMMVLELAPLGPLNQYLQSAVGRNTLTFRDILVLMLQVSMGMQYLESKHYIHRDLAARNVLLVNESFAKISDFGMSRALGLGKDYYKAKAGSKWPLKWFAPESIYYFKFSSKSDVWAYGVTLWEAISYGSRPYEGMDSVQILRFLNDKRLAPPPGTPDVIQDLLTRCWAYRPEERPTFAQIVQTLTCYLFLPSNSGAAS